MPKETIQDTIGGFDVRVGWSPDGVVQVGVETADGRALTSVLYGDAPALLAIGQAVCDRLGHSVSGGLGAETDKVEAMTQLGRSILDIIEGSQTHPGSAPSYTGVWSTLDRVGINRLIRTARRARDAAYGRDE